MRLTQYHKDAIIRCVRNDIPKPDAIKIQAEIAKEIDKLLLPAVKKLAKTNPDALRHQDLSWYDMGLDRSYAPVLVGNVTKEQIKTICEPYFAQHKRQREVMQQLSYTLKGINTLAQAKKLLPEFISYFPTEEEPTKNLPAVANLVADLSKLGWPKSAKPVKAAAS